MLTGLSGYLPENTLTLYDNLEFLIRLLLSAGLGALVGLERSKRQKEAGVRTHCIIACTSALFMILSKYSFIDVTTIDGLRGADPARIAAQVVSGISFLGAGVIFKNGNSIRGLTTAAGLWAAAIIGLVCGAGYVECAIFATAVVLLVEVVLVRLETRLTSKSTDLTLYIEYAHAVCMESVLALLRERSIRIDNLEISRISDSDAPDAPHHYCALIPIHSRTPLQPGDLRGDLTALPDMPAVEEM